MGPIWISQPTLGGLSSSYRELIPTRHTRVPAPALPVPYEPHLGRGWGGESAQCETGQGQGHRGGQGRRGGMGSEVPALPAVLRGAREGHSPPGPLGRRPPEGPLPQHPVELHFGADVQRVRVGLLQGRRRRHGVGLGGEHPASAAQPACRPSPSPGRVRTGWTAGGRGARGPQAARPGAAA